MVLVYYCYAIGTGILNIKGEMIDDKKEIGSAKL